MGKEEHNTNIITGPPAELPQFRGLGSTFFYKMREHKPHVAQTDGITGEQETYETVLQKSTRTAIAMRKRGIKPKDIVAICSHVNLNCYIPFYASSFLGAIPVGLDPIISDTAYVLKTVRPKIVFVVPEAVKLIEENLKQVDLDAKIVVLGDSSTYETFADFIVPYPEENDFVPYEVENIHDLATVVFTSGTTGEPKPVCLSHLGMLRSTYIKNPPAPPGNGILFTPSPLNWISSTTWIVYTVRYGWNKVMCSNFNPEKAWDFIERHKINMVSLLPPQYMAMFKNPIPSHVDLSCLKVVLLVGYFITEEFIRHIRKCLPNVVVRSCYGCTETISCAVEFAPDVIPEHKEFMEKKPTSIGKPLPGYTYKVVDLQTGKPLGPNQAGELRIKTPFVIIGYFNRDASAAFDEDGFFKTGDVVYYDEDQCFFILDRIKDVIQTRARQVSPIKLEAVFRTHPAVAHAVVISAPYGVYEDGLMGLVILKEEYVGKVTQQEINSYVDERVEDHEKMSDGVMFVKAFPFSFAGKIKRREVRQMVMDGKI